MFRSFLSACSVVVLVLPTLLFPTTSRACPVIIPETLLSLYRNSDAIFIARFDKAEDADIVEDSDRDTVLNVRKEFYVSSALKGELRKLFVLEEREYRYKQIPYNQTPPDEPAEAEENDEGDAPYSRPTLKPGDTVLLFLKEQHNPNGTVTLGLTHFRDAIKKISGERLDAYEASIRDLNSIFGGKTKADDAKIVDWLVRTAQDPLTRWEGAFELQQSYQAMQWQESSKQEAEEEESKEVETSDETAAAEEPEETEAAEPEVEIKSEESDAEKFDNAVYARLLTDAQKQTLMNVLVEPAAEQTGAADPKPMSEGDHVLIQLVSNWGNSKLAKVLLEKIQREGEDPYAVYRLMETMVSVLGDEELEKVADEYGDVYYEDADSVVESDDDEEEVADEEESPADASENSAVVAENSSDADKAASDEVIAVEESGDGAKQAHRVTYGELRAEVLAKFVARTAVAIANAEAKEIAKAER